MIKEKTKAETVTSQDMIRMGNWAANKYFATVFGEGKQDAVSSAILFIINYKDRYDPTLGLSLAEFCLQMARNGVLKYRDKRSDRMIRGAIKLGVGGGINEIVESESNMQTSLSESKFQDSPYLEVAYKDLTKQTLQKMEKVLSEREKTIIHLHFWKNQTYRQIAKKVKITHQACYKICRKGLDKIRESLEHKVAK